MVDQWGRRMDLPLVIMLVRHLHSIHSAMRHEEVEREEGRRSGSIGSQDSVKIVASRLCGQREGILQLAWIVGGSWLQPLLRAARTL